MLLEFTLFDRNMRRQHDWSFETSSKIIFLNKIESHNIIHLNVGVGQMQDLLGGLGGIGGPDRGPGRGVLVQVRDVQEPVVEPLAFQSTRASERLKFNSWTSTTNRGWNPSS